MDRREFLSSAATLLVLPLGTFLVHCGSNDNSTSVSSNPNDAHTHTITITTDDLMRPRNGETVKIPTSTELDHNHVLTLVKV